MRTVAWDNVDWNDTHCGNGSPEDQHHVGCVMVDGQRFVALRVGSDSDAAGMAATILLDADDAQDLAALLRRVARDL